jgi:predicted RNA-binding protein YlxR (DUF448 family)
VGDPERQCIGCGLRGPQSGFVRLTVVDEGGSKRVAVADGRRHSGRGAYLCRRQACMERAMMRKAFQRAFRTSVEVDRDCLGAAVIKGEGPGGFDCR